MGADRSQQLIRVSIPMKALTLSGLLLLAACTTGPQRPIGFSSWGVNADGQKVRVYTTFLPDGSIGRTTGKGVNCFQCVYPKEF